MNVADSDWLWNSIPHISMSLSDREISVRFHNSCIAFHLFLMHVFFVVFYFGIPLQKVTMAKRKRMTSTRDAMAAY